MIYILTNTTTVLKTEVRPQESQVGDPSVKAQLNLTLKQKLTPQSFQDQQHYLNSSAIAAYVSLNKLDQRQRFRAGINLTAQHGDSYNFSLGSSSSGLGYALALFESWWRVVLKKTGNFEYPIFATGEILTSGHVLPISHVCEKIDSVCAYVEENQDQFTQFSICYPIQNDNEITQEQRKKIAELGGGVVTVTRLQNLIGKLLGDFYDGDPLGRWSPFKGLSSFDYEDSVRFFGRSKDVNRLYEDLKQNQGLLIVSGASGTGKSSLIKAGLIPKLEQVSNQFSWAYTTPSKVPEKIGLLGFLLEELNNAWQIEKKGLSITELISTIACSPNKAIEKISSIVNDKTPPCLIYFDQFEEVFSQPNENIVSTLKVLNDLANQLKPLDIVLSIRNEYLGRLLDNQALSSPVISNVASQLELDDWQAIIHEQSAFSGITFEHDDHSGRLDKVIIDEASKTPYALPMVEFLLEQLYLKATLENSNASELKYKHYEDLGGLTGAIAYRATQVLNDNKANEKLTAQFFDTFVGLNGEFLPYAKHVDLNKLEENYSKIFKLAQQFIDANLIVSVSNNGGHTTIKLVHDSLFVNWNELRIWVTKNKDYLEWRYSVDGQFLSWRSEQKNIYLIKDKRLLKEGLGYLKNGIVSDIRLAKYLKLSKKNKTNVRFGFSFIFIILPLLIGSLYYWDQQRIKSYYFANIGEKWSVPFGIYELNKEEIKHLGKYYRLDYQGGVLKKLRYQNSAGELRQSWDEDNFYKDSFDKDAALWEYKYTADGNLLSVDIKTFSRKLIRVDKYIFDKNESQVFIGKSYFHIQPFDIPKTLNEFKVDNAGISQYKYFYNESGFITKKFYLNAYGKRISDDAHTGFGEKLTYTQAGQISIQLFLGQDGQPLKSSEFGTVEYKQDEKGFDIKKIHVLENSSNIEVRKYDKWGNNTEIIQTSEGGQLIGSPDKPSRIVLKYDDVGNKVEKFTFNKEGHPMALPYTYAREVMTYDSFGRQNKLDGYEHDIKLKNSTIDGWKKKSSLSFLWDKKGNLLEFTGEEYDQQAQLLEESHYKVKFLYDQNENLIQRTALDKSENFLSDSGNHSYVKYKYNDSGAIIEQAAFDPGNKKALFDDYYHKLVLSYDEVGLNVERAYFGRNDEPVSNKEGVWKYVYEYDDFNRLISISHYYPTNKLKKVVRYDETKGGFKDVSEEGYWYKKAAELGDIDAQYNLALIYHDVNNDFTDISKAIYWYEKAAEQGDDQAQLNLGFIYNDTNGDFKDTSQAVYWYKKSAEQGNVDAQFNLALVYYDFDDVNGDLKNISEAIYWYKKAAENGDVNAQLNLGYIFNDISSGFKDTSKAIYWFKKSAEQGDADAKRNLSLLLKKQN